jgi:hypothetical protein
MKTLTEAQRWILLNALTCAAQEYLGLSESANVKATSPSFAEQFERQHKDALALYDVIEQAELILIEAGK